MCLSADSLSTTTVVTNGRIDLGAATHSRGGLTMGCYCMHFWVYDEKGKDDRNGDCEKNDFGSVFYEKEGTLKIIRDRGLDYWVTTYHHLSASSRSRNYSSLYQVWKNEREFRTSSEKREHTYMTDNIKHHKKRFNLCCDWYCVKHAARDDLLGHTKFAVLQMII